MDAGPDREPDYRMTLAAERTYLAYARTALAFMAGGVAVAGALPDAGAVALRRALGIGLVVISALIFVFARARLSAVTRAMRHGDPLPAVPFRRLSTGVLLVVAIVAAVIVVLA